jgi:hypothetical protein
MTTRSSRLGRSVLETPSTEIRRAALDQVEHPRSHRVLHATTVVGSKALLPEVRRSNAKLCEFWRRRKPPDIRSRSPRACQSARSVGLFARRHTVSTLFEDQVRRESFGSSLNEHRVTRMSTLRQVCGMTNSPSRFNKVIDKVADCDRARGATSSGCSYSWPIWIRPQTQAPVLLTRAPVLLSCGFFRERRGPRSGRAWLSIRSPSKSGWRS